MTATVAGPFNVLRLAKLLQTLGLGGLALGALTGSEAFFTIAFALLLAVLAVLWVVS